MQKILVITDLHIQADGETIINIDPAARLRAALSHAQTTHPDATQLILTGDLTHHGLHAEYESLHAILRDVAIPITFLMGNHDHRATFLNSFPNTPTQDGFVQTAFDTHTHRIITLDSLDQSPDNPRKHSGYLCDTRLAWLDAQLSQTTRDTILFIHHPPVDVGFDGMDAIGLRNAADLRALIARHPHVKHLIAGHIHRTISGSIGDLSFSIFKSPCHQMPMITQSDDSSLSVNEPGAYGILFLSPGQIIVHTEDFETALRTGKIQQDAQSK